MTNAQILAEVRSITKEENPCNLHEEKGVVVCNNKRQGPCCGGCKHLSNKGCMVEAAACRFWFCTSAMEALSQLAKQRLAVLLWEYDGPFMWRHDDPTYQTGKFFGRHMILLQWHPKAMVKHPRDNYF